ncbi:MAG TPA: hypothetical protein VIL31_00295 [Cyclobacteriaceae bacterium]|jgi:hypothetical protein
MSKSRIIFYCIFAAYHASLCLFSIYVYTQRDNVQFLLDLRNRIPTLMYLSFIGLILLGISIVWSWSVALAHRKEKDHLNHEINILKAKLFDIQEEQRKADYRPSPEPPKTQ